MLGVSHLVEKRVSADHSIYPWVLDSLGLPACGRQNVTVETLAEARLLTSRWVGRGKGGESRRGRCGILIVEGHSLLIDFFE